MDDMVIAQREVDAECEKQVNVIRKANRESAGKLWSIWLQNKYGVPLKVVIHQSSLFEVNDFIFRNYVIDEYENLMAGKFSGEAQPIQELLAVTDLWAYYQEMHNHKHPYRYRSLHGILIRYFKSYYKDMSARDLLAMLEQAMRLPTEKCGHERHGFYAWLMTDSYRCTDSALLNTSSRVPDFKDWKNLEAFGLLWENHSERILAISAETDKEMEKDDVE